MRMTVDDLLIEARGVLRHRPGPAKALAAQAADALLVDIRSDDLRRAGGLVPWGPCAAPPLAGVALRSRAQGFQSSLAAATLHGPGLVNATDLDGGLVAWAAASLPLVARTRPRKRPQGHHVGRMAERW